MTRKHKLVALVLAFAIFFAMVLSVAVITHDWDHECAGIDCAYCQQVKTVRQVLEMLILGALSIAFALACISSGNRFLHRLVPSLPQGSLIVLKVELLN